MAAVRLCLKRLLQVSGLGQRQALLRVTSTSGLLCSKATVVYNTAIRSFTGSRQRWSSGQSEFTYNFNIQDEDDFQERVINSKTPTVVDFHAESLGVEKSLRYCDDNTLWLGGTQHPLACSWRLATDVGLEPTARLKHRDLGMIYSHPMCREIEGSSLTSLLDNESGFSQPDEISLLTWLSRDWMQEFGHSDHRWPIMKPQKLQLQVCEATNFPWRHSHKPVSGFITVLRP